MENFWQKAPFHLDLKHELLNYKEQSSDVRVIMD